MPAAPLPCEPPPPPTKAAAILARIPPWVQATGVLLGVSVGLIVGGVVGGILLLLAMVTLTGVLGLAWPVLSQPERLLRIAVVVLLAALTLVRILPGRA